MASFILDLSDEGDDDFWFSEDASPYSSDGVTFVAGDAQVYLSLEIARKLYEALRPLFDEAADAEGGAETHPIRFP